MRGHWEAVHESLALAVRTLEAARKFNEARQRKRVLVAEAKHLKQAGAVFAQEPARQEPVMLAVFKDTCGNLIQMHQAV
jgi:hypothetical protein